MPASGDRGSRLSVGVGLCIGCRYGRRGVRIDGFQDDEERRCLGTAHGELVRAREALKEAERFLLHTRLAAEPDAMRILRATKDQIVSLSSSIKEALDAWDDEHRET